MFAATDHRGEVDRSSLFEWPHFLRRLSRGRPASHWYMGAMGGWRLCKKTKGRTLNYGEVLSGVGTPPIPIPIPIPIHRIEWAKSPPRNLVQFICGVDLLVFFVCDKAYILFIHLRNTRLSSPIIIKKTKH